MTTIRTRMAPTPSGTLHLGTAHTALFNWLFAKANGGQFVLRIDDTDPKRYSKEFEQNIIDGLKWLGLDWDEGPDIGGPYGPYRQSLRGDIYKPYLKKLIDEDKVYPCFCSKEELQAERQEMQRKKLAPKYSGKCRAISKEDAKKRLENGETAVMRLKVPHKKVTFHDPTRGDISVDSSLFGDFTIARSDGSPLLMLATTVDDIEMKITHTIRGEDYLNFVPRQILLFEALGITPPIFAHKPFLYGPDGTKLSKRHGATSIDQFREDGYLSDMMVNFLVLMGWSPGTDEEIFSRDDLISRFTLEAMQPSMPRVNEDKMKWMNGMYIRAKSMEEIFDLVKPYLAKHIDLSQDEVKSRVMEILPLVYERIGVLSDIWELVDFFFVEGIDKDINRLKPKKRDSQEATNGMDSIIQKLSETNWTHEEIEHTLRSSVQELGWKVGELFMMIRIGITGKKATPPLFETMVVMGKENVLHRLEQAKKHLE